MPKTPPLTAIQVKNATRLTYSISNLFDQFIENPESNAGKFTHKVHQQREIISNLTNMKEYQTVIKP